MLEPLAAAMARIEGVVVSPSMFADKDAFWVDGREIAHLHAGALDLRLTRDVIRLRRKEFEADARVTLRSSSSDWLELAVNVDDDVAWALDLVEVAVVAHLPVGRPLRPPPRGSELERRRRFH